MIVQALELAICDACFGFLLFFFFFFNDTATTEIYTLSLHDALPIWPTSSSRRHCWAVERLRGLLHRSEEHTSELQSRQYLVCRLLLEKKKKITSEADIKGYYHLGQGFTAVSMHDYEHFYVQSRSQR